MFSPKFPAHSGAEPNLLSHVIELRDRIIRMLSAIAIVGVFFLIFANDLYSFVAEPLIAQLPAGSTMIATQVITPFSTPFKLALVAAIFFAMPYLLYQFWEFVAPGLYQHEKRFAVPLLVSSIALFYLGIAFAYYLVFPAIFGFMAATTPDGVAMMTDIAAYLDFVLTLFFAFGLAFEIPIATILLVVVGIVTIDSLVDKRPYIIVGAFIVGMFLTPPDIFSQTMLAVPMLLLFELGIICARFIMRQRGIVNNELPAPPRPTAPAVRPPSLAKTSRADVGADEESEYDQQHTAPASAPIALHPVNSVEAKLLRAQRLRELNNLFATRQVLYEVLEEGDVEQRAVARNILAQLDDD
jgi:sec-independent protein translocase protein TatC